MQRDIKTRKGYDVWDKLCEIPRHAFLLSPEGNRVVKVPGMGSWIDMYTVQSVVDDAQTELNILRDALERIRDKSSDLIACEIAAAALVDSKS